jgi:maleate isomerase
MNRDTLAFHAKIGVIIPSTNAIVELALGAMQPAGVTNYMGRAIIPSTAIGSDANFEALDQSQMASLECIKFAPDHLILSLSYETFWSSREQGQAETEALRKELNIGVSNAQRAIIACLQERDLRRIAVLPPYKPIIDAKVHRFFNVAGFEMAGIKGLFGNIPSAPARVSREDMAHFMRYLADCGGDAIVQVSTNLATARLARKALNWLGLPVLAANSVLDCYALKQLNLLDDAAFCAEWMPLQC